MLTSLQGVPRTADITLDELRQIILEGAVLGAKKLIAGDSAIAVG
jgi:hypothetical protein